MNIDTLSDVFEDQLKDLYSAETQITNALPKMIEKVSSETLRDALSSHLEETKKHVERLDTIGQRLGIELGGKTCKGMKGLLEEGSEVLKATPDGCAVDILIVAAAQRVEHYEMAGYGNARTFAEQLGYEDAAELLDDTLEEEKAADEKLTEICLSDLIGDLSEGVKEVGNM